MKFLEKSEDPEFTKDDILSERAWISYSFIDEIAKNEAERKELVTSSVKMLVDAISINENNVDARTRLGTLIHVFNSSYL